MSEYDLRGLIQGERRRDRWIVQVFVGFVCFGVAATGVFLAGALFLGKREFADVLVMLLGTLLLAFGLWGLYTVKRPSPVSLAVTDRGMEFRLSRGAPRLVAWTNPKLAVYLLDCTAAPRAKRGAYSMSVPMAGVMSDLPRQAFEEILAQASVNGLDVAVESYNRGSPTGAIRRAITAPVTPR